MAVFKRWNGTSWEVIGPTISNSRINTVEELIAPEYDPNSPYSVGDFVVHSDTLYKCNTEIGSGGELWNSTHWTETKIGDEVSDLKSAVNLIEYSVNPNNNGEFIWDLRYGYWGIDSESLVWHPAHNKYYVSSAYPIKVKSGDVIHVKNIGQNIRFFAQFSENGSTWSVLNNTVYYDVIIPSDGYVMVNARKDPDAAFTEKEVELFFDRYLTIYRKTLTNNVIKQIDNINDAKGVIVNDVSFVQSYVTASTSTTEGFAPVPIEFPAAKGETFIIGANISVAHPEYFSKIIISVRERYNNKTISDIRYDDLTQPIEYAVRQTNTSSIIFVIGWVKQSASSVDIGYYESFDYSIYVTKKNDDFSDVMTESGDTWEV